MLHRLQSGYQGVIAVPMMLGGEQNTYRSLAGLHSGKFQASVPRDTIYDTLAFPPCKSKSATCAAGRAFEDAKEVHVAASPWRRPYTTL